MMRCRSGLKADVMKLIETARACAQIAFLLGISSMCFAGVQPGDEGRTIPKPADGPVEVRVGFNVIDITNVNEREEVIEFEGALVLKWKDPRQAYDPADLGPGNSDTAEIPARAPSRIYQGDFAVKEIYEGWRPHVKISNGIGDRSRNHMAIGAYPDGTMVYAEYFKAQVETPMDLRTYPYDRQSLEVYLHAYNYKSNEVVLLKDPETTGTWLVDEGIAEWEKHGIEIREKTIEYSFLGGNKHQISELVVDVNIGRRPGHVILSIILPLLILVSLTWCVFWMDQESLSNRVNISLVGILSVVAYYFVVLDRIPGIPYLTMMDAFIITTFMMLAATVVISFVVDRLNRRGYEKIGDKLDYVCRWAFPLGYMSVIGVIALVYMSMDGLP